MSRNIFTLLKELQKFNEEQGQNKNLVGASTTNDVNERLSMTFDDTEPLTSTAMEDLYKNGISCVLSALADNTSSNSSLLQKWSEAHTKNIHRCRFSLTYNSFKLRDHGRVHSLCFIHALHQLSITSQCNMPTVLESLYLALNDLGYLNTTSVNAAEQPMHIANTPRRIQLTFLQNKTDKKNDNGNILVDWYHQEFVSADGMPPVKRHRSDVSLINNRSSRYLAEYASTVEEREGDPSVVYITALLSLPWIIMRRAYSSCNTVPENAENKMPTTISNPHSKISSSSADTLISRKRTRSFVSTSNNVSSATGNSKNTVITKESSTFDVYLDEHWKSELLYIVAHLYMIHYFRLHKERLPSWQGLHNFLKMFRKTWYSPMMAEIELPPGFSTLQEVTLAFYGMDTLSLHQGLSDFKLESCFLATFGDKFSSVKIPFKVANSRQHNNLNLESDGNIKCVEGLHPRLMLETLRQHGFVKKLSSFLHRRSPNTSDDNFLTPKEETIYHLMRSFLASSFVETDGFNTGAACARDLENSFFFKPSSLFEQFLQKRNMDVRTHRLPSMMIELMSTQLEMLIKQQDYREACLLCNQLERYGFPAMYADQCWEKLFLEMSSSGHFSPCQDEDHFLTAKSLTNFSNVLHLNPLGSIGIKALERYANKQIDASICRGDKAVVVHLQKILFEFMLPRAGTNAAVASALDIDFWELIKISVSHPRNGQTSGCSENFARELMSWNVESILNNKSSGKDVSVLSPSGASISSFLELGGQTADTKQDHVPIGSVFSNSLAGTQSGANSFVASSDAYSVDEKILLSLQSESSAVPLSNQSSKKKKRTLSLEGTANSDNALHVESYESPDPEISGFTTENDEALFEEEVEEDQDKWRLSVLPEDSQDEVEDQQVAGTECSSQNENDYFVLGEAEDESGIDSNEDKDTSVHIDDASATSQNSASYDDDNLIQEMPAASEEEISDDSENVSDGTASDECDTDDDVEIIEIDSTDVENESMTQDIVSSEQDASETESEGSTKSYQSGYQSQRNSSEDDYNSTSSGRRSSTSGEYNALSEGSSRAASEKMYSNLHRETETLHEDSPREETSSVLDFSQDPEDTQSTELEESGPCSEDMSERTAKALLSSNKLEHSDASRNSDNLKLEAASNFVDKLKEYSFPENAYFLDGNVVQNSSIDLQSPREDASFTLDSSNEQEPKHDVSEPAEVASIYARFEPGSDITSDQANKNILSSEGETLLGIPARSSREEASFAIASSNEQEPKHDVSEPPEAASLNARCEPSSDITSDQANKNILSSDGRTLLAIPSRSSCEEASFAIDSSNEQEPKHDVSESAEAASINAHFEPGSDITSDQTNANVLNSEGGTLLGITSRSSCKEASFVKDSSNGQEPKHDVSEPAEAASIYAHFEPGSDITSDQANANILSSEGRTLLGITSRSFRKEASFAIDSSNEQESKHVVSAPTEIASLNARCEPGSDITSDPANANISSSEGGTLLDDVSEPAEASSINAHFEPGSDITSDQANANILSSEGRTLLGITSRSSRKEASFAINSSNEQESKHDVSAPTEIASINARCEPGSDITSDPANANILSSERGTLLGIPSCSSRQEASFAIDSRNEQEPKHDVSESAEAASKNANFESGSDITSDQANTNALGIGLEGRTLLGIPFRSDVLNVDNASKIPRIFSDQVDNDCTNKTEHSAVVRITVGEEASSAIDVSQDLEHQPALSEPGDAISEHSPSGTSSEVTLDRDQTDVSFIQRAALPDAPSLSDKMNFKYFHKFTVTENLSITEVSPFERASIVVDSRPDYDQKLALTKPADDVSASIPSTGATDALINSPTILNEIVEHKASDPNSCSEKSYQRNAGESMMALPGIFDRISTDCGSIQLEELSDSKAMLAVDAAATFAAPDEADRYYLDDKQPVNFVQVSDYPRDMELMPDQNPFDQQKEDTRQENQYAQTAIIKGVSTVFVGDHTLEAENTQEVNASDNTSATFICDHTQDVAETESTSATLHLGYTRDEATGTPALVSNLKIANTSPRLGGDNDIKVLETTRSNEEESEVHSSPKTARFHLDKEVPTASRSELDQQLVSDLILAFPYSGSIEPLITSKESKPLERKGPAAISHSSAGVSAIAQDSPSGPFAADSGEDNSMAQLVPKVRINAKHNDDVMVTEVPRMMTRRTARLALSGDKDPPKTVQAPKTRRKRGAKQVADESITSEDSSLAQKSSGERIAADNVQDQPMQITRNRHGAKPSSDDAKVSELPPRSIAVNPTNEVSKRIILEQDIFPEPVTLQAQTEIVKRKESHSSVDDSVTTGVLVAASTTSSNADDPSTTKQAPKSRKRRGARPGTDESVPSESMAADPISSGMSIASDTSRATRKRKGANQSIDGNVKVSELPPRPIRRTRQTTRLYSSNEVLNTSGSPLDQVISDKSLHPLTNTTSLVEDQGQAIAIKPEPSSIIKSHGDNLDDSRETKQEQIPLTPQYSFEAESPGSHQFSGDTPVTAPVPKARRKKGVKHGIDGDTPDSQNVLSTPIGSTSKKKTQVAGTDSVSSFNEDAMSATLHSSEVQPTRTRPQRTRKTPVKYMN